MCVCDVGEEGIIGVKIGRGVMGGGGEAVVVVEASASKKHVLKY